MRTKLLITFLFFTLFAILPMRILSQAGTVIIQPFNPLPNQLRLSDLWNFSITNVSSQQQAITFRAVVRKGENTVLIATSSKFNLKTGSLVMQGKLLEPVTIQSVSESIEKSINRLSTFPDGNYNICISAVDSESGEVITEQCYDHQVQTALPPILLGPYDESDVVDDHIVWTWFMQSSLSNGESISCDLTVVEWLDGQSPEEALRLNPPVLVRNGLRESAWQTNFATRSFQDGKKYAWRIIAKSGDEVVGESEIWKFTYSSSNIDDNAIQESYDSTAIDIATKSNELESKETQGIKFNVNSKLLLESSNRTGTLSQTPEQFARLQIDPTLELFGVPFGLNLIISTEQNTKKSNLNRGAFTFARNSPSMKFNIQQRIEDKIEEIKMQKESALLDTLSQFKSIDTAEFDQRIEALEELSASNPADDIELFKNAGVISSTEELLLNFPSLGFGKVNPQFSELFFSGVTLNGALAEYNPSGFYTGLAIGKVQRDVPIDGISIDPSEGSNEIITPEFYQNVYSLRFGLGTKGKNNLILSATYADDDEQTLLFKKLFDSTGSKLSPQQNYVLGMSGGIALDSIGLSLTGELNTSVFTENTLSGIVINRSVPSFLVDLLGKDKIKNGSLVDISYAARAKYKPSESTSFAAGVRMIGPGYRSVGTYGLRTDVFRGDLGFEQLFVDRKIKFNVRYANEQTGFVLNEGNKAEINNLIAGLDFRFKNIPLFFINYNYNSQKQQIIDLAETKSISSNLQLSTLYNYRFGNELSSTFISLGLQNGDSNDSAAIFNTINVLLNQRYSFSNTFSIAFSASITNTKNQISEKDLEVKTFDMSAIISPFDFWSNTIGINYNVTEDRQKAGFYLNSSLDLWKAGNIQLYIEVNEFDDSVNKESNFSETVLRFLTSYYL